MNIAPHLFGRLRINITSKQGITRLSKYITFQQVIFTLSDISDEFLLSSTSDNDPIAIGRAVAYYLYQLTLQEKADSGFSVTIPFRIYSFGLAQCYRAPRSPLDWAVSFTSKPAHVQFSNIPAFAKFIYQRLPYNNSSFENRIDKLIHDSNN